MNLAFTQHAIERITERKISLTQVAECLINPDKIIQDKKIFKFLRFDYEEKKLLILVCAINEEQCKIITVIKTTTFRRYI